MRARHRSVTDATYAAGNPDGDACRTTRTLLHNFTSPTKTSTQGDTP